MALATQCPHCRTTFRVAHDQLKLRAGLVRCGACKEIFNGIEHLLPPDEPKQPAAAPAAKQIADSEPAIEPANVPHTKNSDESSAVPSYPPQQEQDSGTPEAGGAAESEAAEPEPETPPPAAKFPSADDDAPADPLTRMTLMDFKYSEDEPADNDAVEQEPKLQQSPDSPDPLEEAIEALQRKPLRSTRRSSRRKYHQEQDLSDSEEPSFVKQGRRRERVGRALQAFMGIGSLVLLVGLLAQSAYVFRDQTAARFPDLKPLLAQGCAILGCRLALPAQIEVVSIESSELQALAPEKNTFELTALLRNHSATMQAWPNLELTLNDANEKAIARRVFLPGDYLGSAQDLTKGFAPKSEQSVKLFFELAQLKASGYRVYLFYP